MCPYPQKAVHSESSGRVGQAIHTGLPVLVPTFVLHRELEEELVGVGMTPYEALKTSATHLFECLEEIDEAGTVQIGKRAKLVLLEANPLTDISNIRSVAGVVLQGRWLSKDRIQEGLPSPAGRSEE